MGGMIGDAGKYVREPRLGIGAVQLCRLDQRVHNRCAAAALVRAAEGPVASAYRNAANGALGGIVRQTDAAIVEETGERLPMVEGIVDGLGERPLGGEFFARGAQPGLEVFDERL